MTSKKMAGNEQKTKTDMGNKQEEQLIYCGPNFLKAGLNQFTVFRGTIPKHIETHFEEKKCPAMRRLFVSPEDLPKTLAAINTNGSSESVWYKQVEQYIREYGKGGDE